MTSKEQVESKEKTTKACRMKGCKRPYRAKGYCVVHYQKWRRGEIEGARPRYRICREEKCRKPTHKAGLCEAHYSAWSASKKVVAPAEAQASVPAAEGAQA